MGAVSGVDEVGAGYNMDDDSWFPSGERRERGSVQRGLQQTGWGGS